RPTAASSSAVARIPHIPFAPAESFPALVVMRALLERGREAEPLHPRELFGLWNGRKVERELPDQDAEPEGGVPDVAVRIADVPDASEERARRHDLGARVPDAAVLLVDQRL